MDSIWTIWTDPYMDPYMYMYVYVYYAGTGSFQKGGC